MRADVLITGGGGMLAGALREAFARAGHSVAAPTRSELDVTDPAAVGDFISAVHPAIVIQCAAYTAVDDAESHESEARRVNERGTKIVGAAAASIGARLVYPSTDYVFDGGATRPYLPQDHPAPVNAYGRSKLAGEIEAARVPDHLIVRMSWLYGPGGRNFVRTIAQRLEAGLPARVVNDQTGSPTWTVDAARHLAALVAADVPPGTYHLANGGTASWWDVASHVATWMDRPALIEPCSTAEYATAARRPRYSALDSTETERVTGRLRNWQLALREALEAGSY